MSLRDFLEKTEAKNEVINICGKVSPRFEISSILNAFPGDPILHFKNVEGCCRDYDLELRDNLAV